VAATNADLAQLVVEKRFREDLFYRISTFPIVLPPLRERKEDIPEMAKYFAEKSAQRFSLPVVYPTDSDIELLCQYTWPGNVRELASVIDRAAILGNGKRLDIEHALGQYTIKHAETNTKG
jgi:transcriptional regulator with GAF, ATPase, and Fis domain